jgi:hypothetical protein
VGTVQDCGCIALPEEMQRQTGLFPGASFRIEAADDGSSVTLVVLERNEVKPTMPGTACPISAC